MWKKIFIALFLFTGTLTTYAQSTTTVTGTVRDSITKLPLEFATVSLATKDGKIVGHISTNTDGTFEIRNVIQGELQLSVTFIGYHSTTKTIRTLGATTNAGIINLNEDHVRLEGVVVTAIGNAMIVKKDTIEYNASSYRVAEGAMLEDLVKKLPGTEVDSDGKITVNGEEIKKVMIDGKVFFADDPQVATKNLPANMIEKVQVVNRRSDQARFTGIDDGEEETVLNLTIRPGMKNGWFGNVMAGGGYEDKYQGGGMVANIKDDRQISILASGNNTNNRGFNDIAGSMMQQGRGGGGGTQMRFGGSSGGGASMNVGGTRMSIGGNGLMTSWLGGVNAYNEFGKNKQVKATGNYFYNGTETKLDQSRYRQNIFDNDSLSFYNQTTNSISRTQGHRVAGEVEWTLNENSSFVFKPTINYGIGSFDEKSNYATTLDNLLDTVNSGSSIASGDNTSISFNGDILFRHKFKTQGRTFTANFVFGYSDNTLDGYNYSKTRFFEFGIPVDSIIDQQYTTASRSYSTNTRLTYTEPLGNNYYLEMAYRVRTNYSTSDKETFNKDISGKYEDLDDLYTNHYQNLFVNQQAELSLRSVREKYNWTVGVTAQPSYIRSEGRGEEAFSRNSLNFSPNGNFTYNFSNTKMFRADYRGRTNEPTISQLQPVPDNSNPLLERLGNPNLDPAFTHNLRLSYRNTNPQSFRTIVSFINASLTTDRIVNNTIYESSTGKQLIVPANVNGVFSAMGNFMVTTPFSRGSKFTITTNTFANFSQNASLSQTIAVINPSDIETIIANSTKNTTRSLSINEMLRLSYKGSKFDINLMGRAGYSKAWYSLDSKEQPTYWNNSVGGDFNWSLPWDLALSSNANYNFYIGYADGYNEPSLVWNAEISKLLFKQKQGTIKLSVYDILDEGRGTNRNITDNYIEDTIVNTLGRYIMLSFTYRFGSFGGNSNSSRGAFPGGGGRRIAM